MKKSDFNKNFFGRNSSGLRKISSRISFWSVFIGVLALIISLSVLEGFDQELKKNAYQFDSHLKLITFDNTNIEDYQTKANRIQNLVEVDRIEAVNENFALVKAGNTEDGFIFKGVESNYLKDRSFKLDGSLKKDQLILSSSVSKIMGVNIGDELIVFLEKSSKAIIKKIKISGIYSSGFEQYDSKVIFTDFDSSYDLFEISKTECSSLEIDLTNPDEIGFVSRTIESMFSWPYYTLSLNDKHSVMFKWIEIQKTPIPIVLGLISLVAAFNIITSLLITIVEKNKQIGILRTLGMSKKDILKLISWGGIRTGLNGVLFGLLIGNLILIIQKQFEIIKIPADIYFIDTVPIAVIPIHNLIIFSSVILLVSISSLIPAYLATRFSPVSVIRDN